MSKIIEAIFIIVFCAFVLLLLYTAIAILKAVLFGP